MTRISALKSGDRFVDVEGFILEKSNVREVVGRATGMDYRVCKFLFGETKKDSGDKTITLVLWNDDIDRVHVGDKLSIKNVYVTEYQGVIQLNVGKYGVMEVV